MAGDGPEDRLLDAWRWAERRGRDVPRGRPALFFDRDGVLVEEVGYLADPADMRLAPGAAAALGAARAVGLLRVLVTNQSGIGRGYYDWAAFAAVQDAMHAALACEGEALDLVYACGWAPPDASAGGAPDGVGRHPWRKPAPGMLLAAAADAGLDLARSAIIGDRAGDLAAGRSAGLAAGALIAGGYGAAPAERQAALALAAPGFRVAAAADLAGAVAAALVDRL